MGHVHVQVRLTPGGVGVNALRLTIVDAARQPIEPVSIPQVRITLPDKEIGPLDRPVSKTGPGRYETVADLPLPGAWQLEDSVRAHVYQRPAGGERRRRHW